ncbi:MAG: GntR family transcriptional regulator [Defluviitaleaceae bacterium]|nr:GntR family transcriptional regulator [Defluviitaleaceae bacterium]MCL2274370.1 GntR family transcriptional regulator [Defluviitaleaceae bacterium]
MKTALYEQIHEDMLQKITSNQWKSGGMIPAEMELCEIYGVSRITVRKAIEELVLTGVLVRQRGKGTFVRVTHLDNQLSKFYSFSESLKVAGISEEAEVLAFKELPASKHTAERLEISAGDTVYEVIRLRSVNDVPYAVEASYLPKALFKGITAKSIADNGLYNSMRQLGIAPVRARETFRAAALDGLEARLLQQDIHSPVMRIERVTYNGSVVVEYCTSTVRGDFFTYTVELGGG